MRPQRGRCRCGRNPRKACHHEGPLSSMNRVRNVMASTPITVWAIRLTAANTGPVSPSAVPGPPLATASRTRSTMSKRFSRTPSGPRPRLSLSIMAGSSSANWRTWSTSGGTTRTPIPAIAAIAATNTVSTANLRGRTRSSSPTPRSSASARKRAIITHTSTRPMAARNSSPRNAASAMPTNVALQRTMVAQRGPSLTHVRGRSVRKTAGRSGLAVTRLTRCPRGASPTGTPSRAMRHSTPPPAR